MESQKQERASLYTIGHSTHTVEFFVGLLQKYSVQTVVDTRTKPYSTRARQFNRESIDSALSLYGIKYEYFGDELGGHPEQDDLYDEESHLVYERIAPTSKFRLGIRKLIDLAQTTCLAVMCTEYDPVKCHRHTLIARYLIERGVSVKHILRDGSIKDATPLFVKPVNLQLPLLTIMGEDKSWRSPKRIHRKKEI